MDGMDGMERGVPYCACEKATVKVTDMAATHLLPTLLHGWRVRCAGHTTSDMKVLMAVGLQDPVECARILGEYLAETLNDKRTTQTHPISRKRGARRKTKKAKSPAALQDNVSAQTGGRWTPAVDRNTGKYGHSLVIDGRTAASEATGRIKPNGEFSWFRRPSYRCRGPTWGANGRCVTELELTAPPHVLNGSFQAVALEHCQPLLR